MPGANRLQAATRRGSLYLASVAALAGWLAVSTVAPYVHLAETVHRTCPEHGELVEMPDLDVAQLGSTAPPDDSVAATAGETGHADDHCLLCPTSAPRGTAAPFAAIGLTTCLHVAVAPRLDCVAVAAHRTLFRVAPKTSPPAPRQA
jgi:hypothetical protein